MLYHTVPQMFIMHGPTPEKLDSRNVALGVGGRQATSYGTAFILKDAAGRECRAFHQKG